MTPEHADTGGAHVYVVQVEGETGITLLVATSALAAARALWKSRRFGGELGSELDPEPESARVFCDARMVNAWKQGTPAACAAFERLTFEHARRDAQVREEAERARQAEERCELLAAGIRQRARFLATRAPHPALAVDDRGCPVHPAVFTGLALAAVDDDARAAVEVVRREWMRQESEDG